MAELIKSCLDRLLIESTRLAGKDLREAVTKAMEDLAAEKDQVVSSGGDPNTIM
jgi:hypothetical protein